MSAQSAGDTATAKEARGTSLSVRLLGGFLGVAAIALAIGVLGYIGLLTTGKILEEVTDVKLVSVNALQVINEAQTAIDGAENALLGVDQAPADALAIFAKFDAIQKRFTDAWKVYEPLPQSAEEAAAWKDFVPAWDVWWKDHLTAAGLAKEYWTLRESGKTVEEADVKYDPYSQFALKTITVSFAAAESLLGKLVQINYDDAKELSHSAEKTTSLLETIMIVAAAVGVVVAVLLGLLISRGITKPLNVVVGMGTLVARGELPENLTKTHSRDEIGVLTRTFNAIVESLRYKGQEASRIAGGDLSFEVKYESEKDAFATSFDAMSKSLNELLAQVNGSVEQVNAGAGQVAAAGQSLSQGATEQASSLEEISSSVTEISSQTRQNAENATQANALSKQAMESATKGNQQMQELVAAMQKIAASSNQIKKVVKVIDDIAFQTNLLALNANVEAARAGKYGKGFAVVADEVRNLAVRSAQSVKETTEMVDGSVQLVADGNKLVEATAAQLKEIVQNASKSADLVEEITTASKEQANALDQITAGLSQIDQVTQANTANAEESAAAGEELSSQAGELRSLVARFKLKNSGGVQAPKAKHTPVVSHAPAAQAAARAAPKPALAAPVVLAKTGNSKKPVAAGVAAGPVDPKQVISLDDDNYGKF